MRWDMSDRQTMKDRRIGDPFLDRRSGDYRREALVGMAGISFRWK
jgi:hypothetical protein